MAEIKRQAEEIDKVRFGDIVFRVQNNRVITWDVRRTFKLKDRPEKLEA